jgi:hypothetical protein
MLEEKRWNLNRECTARPPVAQRVMERIEIGIT